MEVAEAKEDMCQMDESLVNPFKTAPKLEGINYSEMAYEQFGGSERDNRSKRRTPLQQQTKAYPMKR